MNGWTDAPAVLNSTPEEPTTFTACNFLYLFWQEAQRQENGADEQIDAE
jgi:hypothetical protein